MRLLPIFLLMFPCLVWGQELNNPSKLPVCVYSAASFERNGAEILKAHYSKWDKCWGAAHMGGEYGIRTYKGEWLRGIPSGVGEIKFENGGRFSGDIIQGKGNGLGKYFYDHGDFYEGEFRNGLFHGYGKLTKTAGVTFEGQWENDKFIQQAKVALPTLDSNAATNTWRKDVDRDRQQFAVSDLQEINNPNKLPPCPADHNQKFDNCWGSFASAGANYIGEFKNGTITGFGTFTWPNGDKYIGHFKDAKRTGQGTYTTTKGDTYTGDFKDGKRHGKGKFTLPDGSVYVGNFKDNMSSGYGESTFADGEKYMGEWENSLYHGQGIRIFKDGRRQEGIWEKGILVLEKKVDLQKLTGNLASSNAPTGDASHKSVDKINPNNLPLCQKNVTKLNNCWGTRVYGDSSKYVGEFKDDNRHGQGVFTQVTGAYFEGIWENDNLKHAKTIRVGSTDNVTTGSDKSEVKREKVANVQRIALEVSNNAPANDGSFTITIKTNADTASLLIDGKEEGGRPDGNYAVKRVARAGQISSFKIVATDVYGNTDTKTVMVSRAIVESKVNYAALNPAQIKRQVERDAVAIIIGVSNYRTLPKAEFANDDASVFYDYAIRALGVKPENIKLLVDQDAEEVEIIKTFKTWLPSRVKSTTDIYVFYSGHGLPTQDGQGLYLLPPRADRDFISRTAIQFQEINTDLQAAKPKSVTIFMDACYSGQARSGETLVANARPVTLKADKKLFPDNFTVITASQADQISSSSPDLKHGIFSYYLMKGMEGDADANKDGKITLGEMQAYLVENVGRQAGMMSRKQEPQLIGDVGRVLVGVSSK